MANNQYRRDDDRGYNDDRDRRYNRQDTGYSDEGYGDYGRYEREDRSQQSFDQGMGSAGRMSNRSDYGNQRNDGGSYGQSGYSGYGNSQSGTGYSGRQNTGYGSGASDASYGRGQYNSGSQGSYGQSGYMSSQRRDGDYGGSSYGSSYGNQYRSGDGYGRSEEDRGWWDKTRDEVSSWFGDDEARRRREMDDRMNGDAGRSYGNASYGSGSMYGSTSTATSHRGRGPKGYRRSDDRIKEDVNDRLADDHHIDASDVEVEVTNCEVVLTGSVTSREAKRHAEDIVERVSGVSNVENRIRVKREDSSSMYGGNRDGSSMSSTGTTSGIGGTTASDMTSAATDTSRNSGTTSDKK